MDHHWSLARLPALGQPDSLTFVPDLSLLDSPHALTPMKQRTGSGGGDPRLTNGE
jgi:hypothetical protein